MPSGAKVVARVRAYWMNLYIYLAPEDWGRTEGLCGTYDGNSLNDWKLPGTTSVTVNQNTFVNAYR